MKPTATPARSGFASHSSTANEPAMRTISDDDERLDVAEAAVLQEEDDEHVERREADAPDERQAEEQVEGDGGADDLGEVAGGDGDLAEEPQDDGDRPGVVVAAGLGEVAAAGDAEARGERLQQDRHQVRDHDHAEQRVAEAGAAGEVGGPVAGVHVADGDQVARARRRPTSSSRSRRRAGSAIEPWTSGRLTSLAGSRHPPLVTGWVAGLFSVAILLILTLQNILTRAERCRPTISGSNM